MSTLAWWYPVLAWGVTFAALARVLTLGRIGSPWLPVAAGCVTLVPIAGLPVGRWLHGIGQTFSIPFLIVLLDVVTAPFLDHPLLDRPSRRAAAVWGVLAAALLYPAALGVGRFDPYEYGWASPGVAAAAALCGATLALAGNRFGTALLVAGAAWQIHLLESGNAWDYLIDPVYGVAAVCGLLGDALTWVRRRTTAPAIAMLTIFVVATAGVPARGHAASTPPRRDMLDEAWDAAAADLTRRAERDGHPEIGALVRDWRPTEAPGRQRIFMIPSRIEKPEFIDTPTEEAIWSDFVAARRARAAGLFELALEAARAHATIPTRTDLARSPPPPLTQRMNAASALLHEALRDDPDHERARRAGGFVRRDGRWVWPEAARRLDQGQEYDPLAGWRPRGQRERKPGAPGRPDRWSSDHWQIESRAGLGPAASLAVTLEETHDVWRQAFGGFLREPKEMEQAYEGRSRPTAHDPFAAILVADRAAYVAALEKLEPAITRTLGIYWTPSRTAWFIRMPADDDAMTTSMTVRHEATHQLFAEMRKTSPLAGERCGFWAIEAAACYMESLTPTPFGWTLGGREAGRAPAARERLVDDGFHVPLEELCALGRAELQADERLPAIYSEISGLADFFMNGEAGRHREAFVEYLVRIYTGTVSSDTLARLCGESYSDLDDGYRRHMAR